MSLRYGFTKFSNPKVYLLGCHINEMIQSFTVANILSKIENLISDINGENKFEEFERNCQIFESYFKSINYINKKSEEVNDEFLSQIKLQLGLSENIEGMPEDFIGKDINEYSIIYIQKDGQILKLVLVYSKFSDDSNIDALVEYREKTFLLVNEDQYKNDLNIRNDWLSFENCDPHALMQSKTIESIVNYAISSMGIKINLTNPSQFYENICTCLRNRLGASEPYSVTKKIESVEKQIIMSSINNLLPGNSDQLIVAVESRLNPDQFHYNEFKHVKIRICGENIEIIPCYLKIEKKIENKNYLYVYRKESKFYFLEYRQQKFILTKFNIQKIVKNIL